MKQKEQLAAQEQKLEELTLKIEDVETLLDDVSDAAYDKAVEVVTDTVRQETHKEDIRLVKKKKKCFKQHMESEASEVTSTNGTDNGTNNKKKKKKKEEDNEVE